MSLALMSITFNTTSRFQPILVAQWNTPVARETLGVHGWELDILAREIILNCPERGNKSLYSWQQFSRAINMIKEIDNDIYAQYRHPHTENIWLSLFRLLHMQFPWQHPPNQHALLRYFRIFSADDLAPVLQSAIGLTAAELYTIGMALTGNFMDQFGFNVDGCMEIPGNVLLNVSCE